MQALRSIKHDLTLVFSLTALVFLCALAWGHPFIASNSGGTHVQALASQQSPAQAATFTGTVLRDGEQFFLKDSSGQTYRLDDPQHAQTFEGQLVQVAGRLDADAATIHVERIAGA
jgi:hypothetical protein